MKVIEYAPFSWFLLKSDSEFYLDVNCEHSCVGYTWIIQLNNNEKHEYQLLGTSYIDKLAAQIQNSDPAARGSQSEYKNRLVNEDITSNMHKTILEWRKSNS